MAPYLYALLSSETCNARKCNTCKKGTTHRADQYAFAAVHDPHDAIQCDYYFECIDRKKKKKREYLVVFACWCNPLMFV